MLMLFFFFNDTATTEIYTLSLHDALPISPGARTRERSTWWRSGTRCSERNRRSARSTCTTPTRSRSRSEEHTSELQSLTNLVCRLLLEKKKQQPDHMHTDTSL